MGRVATQRGNGKTRGLGTARGHIYQGQGRVGKRGATPSRHSSQRDCPREGNEEQHDNTENATKYGDDGNKIMVENG